MKAVFLVAGLSHYRIPFHDLNVKYFRDRNAEYKVLVTSVHFTEALVQDQNLPKNYEQAKSIGILKNRIVFQFAFRHFFSSQIFIVINENKYVLNIFYVVLGRLLGKKVCTFGHGVNYQQTLVRNIFSLRYLVNFFAHRVCVYTDLCRDELTNINPFLTKKIFPFYNTVKVCATPTPFIEKKLGVTFIGTLRENKKIETVIEVFKILKKEIPEINLNIVGDGPLSNLVLNNELGNYRYHGALSGSQKEAILSNSKLIFNPGLVGLVAVESLKLGTPIVTSTLVKHSPEFSYLRDGENCLLVGDEFNIQDWVQYLVSVLSDEALLKKLSTGCISAGKNLTMMNMSEKFCAAVSSSSAIS